ncbi:Ltp family lipoprotein [Macrococcus animalis]|uniref:Ltp family lipoprotein n=1 Tax=Macrococcus animalis TaxID=3395467 RepID=UPI0039BDCFF2
MAKREKQVYYDAHGNPVEVKKKRNPILMGCGGLLLLFFLLGACGALFSDTDTETEYEPKTTEEVEKEKKDVKKEKEETVEEETEEVEPATEEEVVTEAPEPVETESPESVEEEEETESEDTGDVSREFKAALQSAESYNDFMPMSKAGLYQQLTSDAGDGYPAEAAQYAIDNVDIDYKENAVKSANNYNELMPMSDQELLEQLTSEAGDKYTMEEGQYALQHMDK